MGCGASTAHDDGGCSKYSRSNSLEEGGKRRPPALHIESHGSQSTLTSQPQRSSSMANTTGSLEWDTAAQGVPSINVNESEEEVPQLCITPTDGSLEPVIQVDTSPPTPKPGSESKSRKQAKRGSSPFLYGYFPESDPRHNSKPPPPPQPVHEPDDDDDDNSKPKFLGTFPEERRRTRPFLQDEVPPSLMVTSPDNGEPEDKDLVPPGGFGIVIEACDDDEDSPRSGAPSSPPRILLEVGKTPERRNTAAFADRKDESDKEGARRASAQITAIIQDMNPKYFIRKFTLPAGVLCRSWVGKYVAEKDSDVSPFDEASLPEVVMKEIVPLQPQKASRTAKEALAAVVKDLTYYRVCNHFSLIPYVGAVARDDRVVLWGDYFPLGNLAEEAGDLPEDRILKALTEIGAGLRYLNSRQLPHRHLTLENVLQFEQGSILGDCGLGSLFLGMTADDVYAMGYRSSSMFPPETIATKAKLEAVDPEKCDVWAFGCIAYRLAFGREPFRGKTKEKLFAAVKQGEPDHLVNGTKRLSKGFVDFVSLCLTQEPRDRPPMMAVLRHDYMRAQMRVYSSSSSMSSSPYSFRNIPNVASARTSLSGQNSSIRNSLSPAARCSMELNLSIAEFLSEHSISFRSVQSLQPSLSATSMLPSRASSITPRSSFCNSAGVQLVSNSIRCAACQAEVTVAPSFHVCRDCEFILCYPCALSDASHDPSHFLEAYVIEIISAERLALFQERRFSLSMKRRSSAMRFLSKDRMSLKGDCSQPANPSTSSPISFQSTQVPEQQSTSTAPPPGASTATFPESVAASEGARRRSARQNDPSSEFVKFEPIVEAGKETDPTANPPGSGTPPNAKQTLFFIIPMDLLTEEEKTRFHVSGHLPMGKLRSFRRTSTPSTPSQKGGAPFVPPTAETIIEECIAKQCPELDLHGMSLTAIPAVLFDGRAAHLMSLDLSENCLTELPFEIGFLSNLQELRVSNNQLKALPDGLGDLGSLETLDANHNQLEELPQSLMFSDSLATLSLDFNSFKSIPEVIFDMASLQTAYFAANTEIAHLPPIELFSHIQQPLQLGLDNEPTLFREYEENAGKLKNVTVMWNKIYPDEVIPGLFCGSLRSAQTPHVYERLKITHILTAGRGLEPLVVPGMRQLTIQLDDVENASISHMLEPSFEFIDEALKSGGGCLVHCFAGMSRSASACIAYLMRSRSMRLDDAYNLTKKARPAIYPNKGFFNQLLAYDKELFPDGRPLDIDSMHREIVP